jgi:hypothetical protein
VTETTPGGAAEHGTACVNPEPPTVAPADEGRHDPGGEPLWNESWYFDVADPGNGLGAYLRVGLYPNRGQTWFQLAVAGPDRPLTVVTDERAPLVGGDDLAMATDRWSVTLTAEEPLRRWRVQARATAHQLTDPRAVYRGETGPAVDVALDLVWTTAGQPYHYGVATRYEVSCTVAGTVRVGDEELTVAATGQRDHSWGVRDWWAFGWCWSAGAFADGTAFHLADIRLPGGSAGFGYSLGARGLVPARRIVADEEVDADGLPRRATIALDPGFSAELTPVAIAPLRFVADDGRESRFPRALCRYTRADGAVGWGWTEWNQVPLP